MDKKWAADELQSFVDQLDAYNEAVKEYWEDRTYLTENEIRERDRAIMQGWPIAIQILNRVPSPLAHVVQLGRKTDGFLKVRDVRDVCLQALGMLLRWAETEEHLTPDSPQLAADQLHPWVWDAAQTLWETKHYRAAVQAAATNVNAHVQSLVGRRDVSDSKLMAECFSDKDPEPGKPRLRWPGDPTDEGVKSMNTGIRSFGQGVFAAVRNPATHRLDELTEHQALERLAAFSLLCHLIEECQLMGMD